MTIFTAPDYEPSADEILAFRSWWDRAEPGHGEMTVNPRLADEMLTIPRVYIGNRRLREDGNIQLSWLVPE